MGAENRGVGVPTKVEETGKVFPGSNRAVDVLGNRTDDPMLTRHGLAPLKTTEAAILEQAREKTAEIATKPLYVKETNA